MTRLLIYAGPNGSGKSSLRDSEAGGDAVDRVIDTDRIARTIRPLDPRAADREAGRQALMLFEACLAGRRAMSVETTLSGRTILRRLRSAKAAGYCLELRYVALDAVALNIDRVLARVASGGHFIAPDDIRRRYASSLANLPETLGIVHRAVLIDNSGPLPRPVLEMAGQRIVRIAAELPLWLRPLIDFMRVCPGCET